MTMTRQHFAWIAQAIKDMGPPTSCALSSRLQANVAREFADRLRATNPSFNRDRFLKACGVEDNAKGEFVSYPG